MSDLILLTLATFWAWETVRFPFQKYASGAYAALAPLHPVVVAALPLAILWPDWISALGVAGAVGLLHLTATRFLSEGTQAPVQIPRNRVRGGLPPLP